MPRAFVNKKFLTVQEDANGELFLEFPDDLLDAMNWKPGDVIVWTEMVNGQGYTIEKAKTSD